MFERYKFFELTQAVDESIDSFAAALRLRAKNCGFGDQTESLIRDRIVFGCLNARVKERLLREDNLALKSALDICHADEVSKAQMKVMRSEATASTSVAAAATSRCQSSASYDSCCTKCGNAPHQPGQTCPAKNQLCRLCGKANHFARVCRSKATEQKPQQSNKPHHRSRSRSRRAACAGNRRERDASVNAVVGGVGDLHISSCFIGAGSTSNDDGGQRSWWETLLINDTHVQKSSANVAA